MYNKSSTSKPKINYPKLKTRKRINKENIDGNKKEKKCPQQTKIEYPPLSWKSKSRKFHKIDMIARRKPKKEILKEIKELEEYKKKKPKLKPGEDRNKIINEFQDYLSKNKKSKITLSEKEREKLNIHITSHITAFEQKHNKMMKRIQKEQAIVDQRQELNDLFDKVVEEIQERQKFLKELEGVDSPELKTTVKKEIVERVGELQKITKLIQKIKDNK